MLETGNLERINMRDLDWMLVRLFLCQLIHFFSAGLVITWNWLRPEAKSWQGTTAQILGVQGWYNGNIEFDEML